MKRSLLYLLLTVTTLMVAQTQIDWLTQVKNRQVDWATQVVNKAVDWGTEVVNKQVDWDTEIINKPTIPSAPSKRTITDYAWSETSGSGASGDLSASGADKVVTLTPGPAGVTTSTPLYISGGTGTAEVVTPSATTCTGSATASCTVTLTTSNTHTGAWTIASATAGIIEAAYSIAQSARGTVYMPAGEHLLYTTATLPSNRCLSLIGEGMSTVVRQTFASGSAIVYPGCADPVGYVGGFQFLPTVTVSSGYQLDVTNHADVFVGDIMTRNCFNAIRVLNPNAGTITRLRMFNYTNYGLVIEASSAAVWTSGASVSDLQLSGNPTAVHGILLTASGGNSIAGARFSNLNIATGVNLITVSPGATSQINEIGFSNVILDSFTDRGVYLNSAGGAGTVYQFSNMLVGGSTDTVGSFDIGAAFSNITVSSSSIQQAGAGFEIRGADGVRIIGNSLVGQGSGAAGNFGIRLTSDSGNICQGVEIIGNRIGFSHSGAASGQTLTSGINVTNEAHTSILISDNQIYGSADGLSWGASASGRILNNRWVNTSKPTCAAGLEGSLWTVPGAPTTYEICRNSGGFAWTSLF